MTASSRGTRAAATILRSSRRPQPICQQCLYRTSPTLPTSRRTYAVAAEALKTLDPSPNQSLPHIKTIPPITSTASDYKVHAGILLARAPLLTAPQTSFEKAFFFYQKRLNERLAMPFTRYFYFKKDTPADTDWKIKARERNGVPARELGGYRAYGDESWNDELLDSSAEAAPKEGEGEMGIAEPEWVIESLVRDSKVRAVEGKDGQAVEVTEGMAESKEDAVERPLARRTKSDEAGDERRLDRCLERTLYLVVKTKSGWVFPRGELAQRPNGTGEENLHQAAERILVQSAGINMNTWIVGHVPIGHYVVEPVLKDGVSTSGSKTFFMKGRILAGQADLTDNAFGHQDFKWLTKEEVKEHVTTRYYSQVKDMMGDR